jgi:hypothetical protein
MANLLVCAQRKDSDMDSRKVKVNALPAREGAHCGRKNKRFVKFGQTQVERWSRVASNFAERRRIGPISE